jgi:phosphoserine phosphatase RsbU/P
MNSSPKILIIDDDVTSTLFLSGLLRSEGFTIITASNGPEGRMLATAEQPHLILLDFHMPGENGIQACHKKLLDPYIAHIPVIFISGDSDSESKVACFDAGGVDYITKPYELKEVIARIKTHLKLAYTLSALGKLQAAKLAALELAQTSMLVDPSQIPEAQFAVLFKPLQEAGGDFYDVIQIGDGVFDYIFADISGHDIGASLATAGLKALLGQHCNILYSPAEILANINVVIRRILRSEQYFAIGWLRVYQKQRRAIYTNAGQPPAIYLPRDRSPETLDLTGDLIGTFENVTFEEKEIEVSQGDRFFLFSDGFIELRGKRFADRRASTDDLLSLCTRHRLVDLKDAILRLYQDVFLDGSPQDDIVLLGIDV